MKQSVMLRGYLQINNYEFRRDTKYFRNGICYVIGRNTILKHKNLLGNKCVPYIMSEKSVGNDWLSRKKGKSFLPYYEREQVLLNLKAVDNVINFADHDDTAIEAILKVKSCVKLDI